MVFYCTEYRFYQRILKNSWIFIKKIEILYIQNILRIPSFTICSFNFLVFLAFFFSVLPLYGFQKKFKISVLFYYMDLRIYQKILQNYSLFFFKKNWDIWNPKFQQNSIVYYFFFIFLEFLHFVFYFTYPNLSKNYESFCNVLMEG